MMMNAPLPKFAALALALVVALALASCGSSTTTKRTLTERERDSTLGKSAIPGGAAVTRALEVSDSATARSRRTDKTGQ